MEIGLGRSGKGLGEDWEVIVGCLPDGWEEQARLTGALRRTRRFGNPERLLRTLLIHLAEGCSLRETAVRAQQGGLAAVSDVAVMKRLRASEEWLRWMAFEIIGAHRDLRLPPGAKGHRVRLVDATTVSEPGSTGTDWRLHYALELTTLSCDFFELTDVHGGEGYTRLPVSPGDLILGDPASYVPPTDPLMIESVEPRSGANPITGDVLQPPGAGNANPINGSERSIPSRNDLQYACIFGLLSPLDCTDPNQIACECSDPNNDNPLCSASIATTQERAKAYPGRRALQVLKGVGGQGIVASVCPPQLVDDSLFDFGYRPAVGALVEQLKTVLGGRCLGRALPLTSAGQADCTVVEALAAPGCACPGPRGQMDPGDPIVQAIKQDPLYASAGWNCFCRVRQLTGDDLAACQYDPNSPPVNGSGQPVHGWCYIDATANPPIGNPDLVADCPPADRRIIRFVGDGQAVAGATVFLTCEN